MKKFSLLVLICAVSPVYGQDAYLDVLFGNQVSPNGQTSTPNNSSGVISTDITGQTTGSCTDEQSSMPLKYLMSMMIEKNTELDILHDGRTGDLKVSTPKLISNCASMINLTITKEDKTSSYKVSANFKKKDQVCDIDGCSYVVTRFINGKKITVDTGKLKDPVKFKPTLDGYKECLKFTGVTEEVDGKMKMNSNAILQGALQVSTSAASQTGDIAFVSHGNESIGTGPMYKQVKTNNCEYSELIHPKISKIQNYEDSEKERLNLEAAELADKDKCKDYSKVADFIEKYESFSDELGSVRDNLLLTAAKKSAKAIAEGKETDEDLKVIADFDKYIVQKKVDNAIAIYNGLENLEGEQLNKEKERLKLALADLATYRKAPYFTDALVVKLMKAGKFDDAQKMQGMLVMIEAHQKLGTKEKNIVITPEVARSKVVAATTRFAATLEDEKEKYEITTGQTEGKSGYYADLAKALRSNIATRTSNYTQEIQSEYARTQPGGYCYKYFRNTQKCIQESTERIEQLYAILQHHNKVDDERATEFEKQSTDYWKLEDQGRRYLATQNGDEAPAVEAPPVFDTTIPTPRAQDNTVYNFDYNQGAQNPQMAQGQQPMYPGQQQYQGYQQQPYQQYQGYQQQPYQQPYLGYQAYQGQNYMGMQPGMQPGMPFGYTQQQSGAYPFTWNGGMPQQQQQQFPYGGQQPQQYSFWGR